MFVRTSQMKQLHELFFNAKSKIFSEQQNLMQAEGRY